MIPSVVIASYAKSKEHLLLTKQAIQTALLCGINDIVVVETMHDITYDNVKTVQYPKNDVFCYNRALNIGLAHAQNRYVALCNNDVIFKKGFENIGLYMNLNDIKSASPKCPNTHKNILTPHEYAYFGYRIGIELCGWCICIDTEILPLINGKLDETYLFWFSDNAYGDQLIKANIKHALINAVEVIHLESRTLKTLPRSQTIEYTLEAEKKYRNAKKECHI